MTTTSGRRVGTARQRLLAVALNLFAERGVSGTSLQMIADALGVTKAAVYHQFQSKEDIVLAVLAPAVQELSAVADAAEAQPTTSARLDVALAGLVDLVVRNRRLAAVLHADPTAAQLFRGQSTIEPLAERISHLLTGPDPDAEALVRAAMVGGAIMVAGVDPLLADLDDETLRRHMLDNARRVYRIPAGTPSPGAD